MPFPTIPCHHRHHRDHHDQNDNAASCRFSVVKFCQVDIKRSRSRFLLKKLIMICNLKEEHFVLSLSPPPLCIIITIIIIVIFIIVTATTIIITAVIIATTILKRHLLGHLLYGLIDDHLLRRFIKGLVINGKAIAHESGQAAAAVWAKNNFLLLWFQLALMSPDTCPKHNGF